MAGLWCFVPATVLPASPTVWWVLPPAWIQTDSGTVAARPGSQIDKPALVITGPTGRATIRFGNSEETRLSGGAMWHWPGPGGTAGNVLQGDASQGAPRAGPAGAPGLHADGLWALHLGPAMRLEDAERVAGYLANNGYPSEPAQRGPDQATAAWWVQLKGFSSADAARSAGQQLLGMVPGLADIVVGEQPR